MGILSWILFGLIAGILAKWIMPGRVPGGFMVTILIGIARLCLESLSAQPWDRGISQALISGVCLLGSAEPWACSLPIANLADGLFGITGFVEKKELAQK